MAIDSPSGVAKWRYECEQAVLHASTLLRLADRRAAASAVLEMIRTVPRSREEAHYREESFFLRCAEQALKRHASWEKTSFDDAIAYFERLAKMHIATRAFLEACIAGVLIGGGMGG